MLSILIITKNEENDVAGCIRSVAWSDDVWVYDSFSEDRTAEIARECGAQVVQRKFDTYSAQRNTALETLPFKHDWIFLLDCDERLSVPLYEEIRQRALAAPMGLNGFRIRRHDYFMGTWLKHAQTTPFYIRVMRKGYGRYLREINEVLIIDGEIGEVTATFDHFPFSKGLTRWIAKHNNYASAEARIVANQSFRAEISWKRAFFEKDFHKRHAARKAIFYSMPGRPLVRWAYLMFYRGGILDGRAGFVYSTLQAIYEWFIVLKTRELLDAEQAKQSHG